MVIESVCVCFFVPYTRPQFWVDRDQFGRWHPYTLQMVMCRLLSAARARIPRAIHMPLQMSGELHQE